MILSRFTGAGSLLLATLFVAEMPTRSAAQQPGAAPSKPAEKKVGFVRPRWNDKLIAFEMRGKEWKTVFEWFSDQTGMPYSSKYPPPTGTFTFINPKVMGKPREYTIAEIFDIINEVLQAQNKFTLLRREHSLTLVPADEPIPADLVRRLDDAKELDECARTEVVQLMVVLVSLNADEFAPEAKKMLGDMGQVIVLTKANALILQADVTNLRRTLSYIKLIDLPGEQAANAETYTHKCKYIKASDAKQALSDFLGNPVLEVSREPRGQGGPMGFEGGRQPQPAATKVRHRPHTVTADEATNTVLVNGPPDKIAQAKAVMAKLDVPRYAGDPGRLIGPPAPQYHEVAGGNAEMMSKMLVESYKNNPSVRIQASGPSRIFVWADPQTHLDIDRYLNVRPPEPKLAIFPLHVLDATKTAESLKLMFPGSKDGSPFIEADTEQSKIRVRGTPELVQEVEKALKMMDENPAMLSGGMSVINLDKGSAVTLAEALKMLYPNLRANPIQVYTPGSIYNKPLDPEARPTPKKILPAKPKDPFPKKGDGDASLEPVSFQKVEKPQLVDPEKQPKSKDDLSKKPVTITAFGNRLIVTSDDPQALGLVRELVRLLVNTEAGPGDFEVIRLQNANAVEVAKILDEAFNGPKQQGGGGGGGRGGGGFTFPGGGLLGAVAGLGGGGGTQRTEIIRVVADPATNALLVRAKPLDMMTIRSLLKNSIDTNYVDNNAVIKTFIIGPLKNANAHDVAEIIERVYQANMRASTQTVVQGGFGFFGGARTVDPTNTSQRALLSVGVDQKTNSLVVACPTTLYEDVKRLVGELEIAAADSKQVVRVVSIQGVDPAVLKQAIDSIQGLNTGVRPTSSSLLGGGSTFGQGGTFSPAGNRTLGNFPNILPGGGGFQGGGLNPGGGRFQGGGGGFNPGGGGGFNPGGGGRGPGGGPGGGGLRQGGGGRQSRGPDFFEQRVKDDPSEFALLYDPSEEQEPPAAPGIDAILKPAPFTIFPSPNLFQTAAGQPKEPDKGPQLKDPRLEKVPVGAGKEKEGSVVAPRLPVTIEVLDSLGSIVIRANNPADLEAVLAIIELIRRVNLPAAIEIELVPLRFADPTSVTNQLNQLYNRVVIGPNSTAIIGARPGGQVQTPLQQPGQQIPFGGGGAQPQQQQQASQAAQPSNIVLLPQPRLSAILVAASKARMPDIKKEIQRLDQPVTEASRAVPFQLQRAPAVKVAQLINNYYADRYGPAESRSQHQVRITWDDDSQTVFVQAAPADMADIRYLIEYVDRSTSKATNELRVVPLRNAIAVNVANLLTQSIANGLVPAQTTAPGVFPTQGTGGAGVGGIGGGGLGGGGLGGGGLGGGGLGGALGQQVMAQTPVTKVSSLRFITNRKDGKPIETGVLEDIRINADPRINSLVITAPEKTMQLILALVKELDTVPNARSEINIFQLRRADATLMALTLQRLFLGNAGVGATGGGVGGGGAPGGVGAATGGPGTLGVPGAGGTPPLQLTVSSTTPEGAVIIDLRLTVDERTNSLIIAGNRNDLDVIEAIISRLEDAEYQQRRNEAIRLRNAQAADVAAALTPFLTQLYATITKYGQETNYLGLQREVIVVAEPISNSLLVSATPQYFDELVRMIAQLDTTPPQVVVQVLIAEVDVSGSHEFGVEIGLQTPVLFNRGVYPAPGQQGTGSVSYVAATSGQTLVPTGASVNAVNNPTAFPAFNFNQPQFFPGTNPVVNPSLVGFQGLSSLGVGRTSPTNNIGGFVFSASSNSVNVLVRALQIQNRVDVLSRPQIMTLDNQTASINVGKNIPLVSTSTVTVGTVTQGIVRQNVGIIMQVTPRITPDGRILMRVIPEVSSVDPVPVNLGNGNTSVNINVQHLETTVLANDGETVLLGGLITRSDSKTENKVPWLGDLPHLGWMFRYRTDNRAKTELLIIMTPHIVRNHYEGECVLAEEARRMDWMLGTVLKTHGNANSAPFMQPLLFNEGKPGMPPYRIYPPGPSSLDLPPASLPFNPQLQRATPPSQTMQANQPAPVADAPKAANTTPAAPAKAAAVANNPVPTQGPAQPAFFSAGGSASAPIISTPQTPLLGGGQTLGGPPSGAANPTSQGRER